MLRQLILAVLRDGKPRHGYGIMKEYRDAVGADVGVGSFYREIQRLADEGLVKPASNPVGADPRRIPYEITPRGMAEFDRWLPCLMEEPMVERQDEVMLRAFLVSRAGNGAELIARWRAELAVRCEVARLAHEATRRTSKSGDTRDDGRLRILLLARRSQQAAADAAFVEEFERALRGRHKRSGGEEAASGAGGAARSRRPTATRETA